jgi:prepilin-type N-terminal cleavage/methylation domain-containing protein
MNLRSQQQSSQPAGRPGGRRVAGQAFTILELLLVITIIGIMAALAGPLLKGIGAGDKVTVGGRQLLDDLSLARAKAIATRSTVYMVFLPTNLHNIDLSYYTDPADKRTITNNLIGKTYTGYALYAERSVGDQPGVTTPRYLSEWKDLPQGIFIIEDEFNTNSTLCSFSYRYVHFPTAESPVPNIQFPYIAFNSYGQLIGGQDLYLSIAEGSVGRPHDPDNQNSLYLAPSVARMEPPDNYTNQTLYVNWLTGRGKVIRPEIQ